MDIEAITQRAAENSRAAKRARLGAPEPPTLGQQLQAMPGHVASLVDAFKTRLPEARREMKQLVQPLQRPGATVQPELEVRLGLLTNGGVTELQRLFPSAGFDPQDPKSWAVDTRWQREQGGFMPPAPFVSGVSGAVLGSMAAALTLKLKNAGRELGPEFKAVVTQEVDVLHTPADVGDEEAVAMGAAAGAEVRERSTFTLDALGGAFFKERIRKHKSEMIVDLALRARRYDLRLGCAAEERRGNLDDETASQLYTDALQGRYAYRKKLRKGFRPRVLLDGHHVRSQWRVDLTWVTATDTNGEQEMSYEVEVELAESAVHRLLSQPSESEELEKLVEQLSKELDEILLALNPREEAGLEDLHLVDDVASAAEDVITACMKLNGRNLREGAFPGVMPVNMSRRSLTGVQSCAAQDFAEDRIGAPYLCAEKTDGVRYLLVVTSEGEAALLDRKMRAFAPPGGVRPIGGCFPRNCVIDGELVLCRRLHKGHVYVETTFLAFDLLADGSSEPLMGLSFAERLDRLESGVVRRAKVEIQRLQQAFQQRPRAEEPTPGEESPLRLRVKHFYRLRELPDLLACLRVPRSGVQVEGDTLFPRRREILTAPERSEADGREALRHLTDGVIFAPNTPYFVGTDTTLLKWKFPDTVSIDLRVEEVGDKLDFTTFGEREDVSMNSVIHLHASDAARLRGDMAALGRRDVAIAELAADSETGEWVFCGLRPDKDKANFIGTVLATLQDVGSGLGLNELTYRLQAPSPLENDWARHISKMEEQTVKWKVKEKAKERAAILEQFE